MTINFALVCMYNDNFINIMIADERYLVYDHENYL